MSRPVRELEAIADDIANTHNAEHAANAEAKRLRELADTCEQRGQALRRHRDHLRSELSHAIEQRAAAVRQKQQQQEAQP